MTKLQNVISILTLTILCACNNSWTNKAEETQNDSIDSEMTSISEETSNQSTLTNEEEKVNKITTLKFKELSISTNLLLDYMEDHENNQIQEDTVQIYVDFGETVEDQLISVSSDQLTNLKIEQRYETSMVVSDEGKVCIMTDWKHYNSDWKQLQPNNDGQFNLYKYSEMEQKKFPEVTFDEFKQKVKAICGDEYLKTIENGYSPTDYLNDVDITCYYLKVTGQRNDNGQTVTKLIMILPIFGC